MNEKCKTLVWTDFHNYQCCRKAVKDGYCKQHHPDTVKARKEKSIQKFEKDSYKTSERRAFWFVNEATEEDLKALSEAINKKLNIRSNDRT